MYILKLFSSYGFWKWALLFIVLYPDAKEGQVMEGNVQGLGCFCLDVYISLVLWVLQINTLYLYIGKEKSDQLCNPFLPPANPPLPWFDHSFFHLFSRVSGYTQNCIMCNQWATTDGEGEEIMLGVCVVVGGGNQLQRFQNLKSLIKYIRSFHLDIYMPL